VLKHTSVTEYVVSRMVSKIKHSYYVDMSINIYIS